MNHKTTTQPSVLYLRIRHGGHNKVANDDIIGVYDAQISDKNAANTAGVCPEDDHGGPCLRRADGRDAR